RGDHEMTEVLEVLTVQRVLKVRVLKVLTVLLVLAVAAPVAAMPRRSPAGAKVGQSPNNSGIVVTVTDQAGLVVKDAKVSVTDTQTATVREAMSGNDGSASVPGL